MITTVIDQDKCNISPLKYQLQREKTYNQVVRNKSGQFRKELKNNMKSLVEDLNGQLELLPMDLQCQRVVSYQAVEKKRRVTLK